MRLFRFGSFKFYPRNVLVLNKNGWIWANRKGLDFSAVIKRKKKNKGRNKSRELPSADF